jgi:PAS domain S-box-containing protein
MVARPAFTVVSSLVQGETRTLYRAMEKGRKRRSVLLEVGSSTSGYELTRTLSAHSVLKPIGRTMYEGVSTSILEDFDGVSLESLLGQPMELEQFLRVGLAIAEAIAEVHREGVIHKDIRPESVLVDTATRAVKLVGFSIATRAPREPAMGPPRLIEGSLPYMSPEQTGRMNRAMDQRSDLYSLGVTFYRMLTGRLPFVASDPVEWAYCHVAREPVAPSEHVPGLPAVVSDIVLKLLAKVAEDRYQTAYGVAVDLGRCLERWTKASAIAPFRLGDRDVSDRVHLPARFYGREPELERLLTAFHRVVASGKPELVLVSGPPGVGKSSLVRELHRPLVREHGSFIAGKADQYSQGVPYSTIATGLRDLVLEAMTESEPNIARLRSDVGAALAPNARVVVELIPELELLIGRPPPVPQLDPEAAKNRFFSTCQKLVAVLARKEHPITLFLDDLQWADAASLELLQCLLVHPETRHVLALGAYRDTEVGPSHPLVAMLDEVRRTSVPVTDLRLCSLSNQHVAELVSDALHAPAETSAPLGHLIHRKTGGNPFFVIQFMGTLIRDGLLAFDCESLGWRWEVPRIEASDYTDNVVALMIQKIERLPEETRSILRLAACAGTVVETGTLKVLAKRPEDAIDRAMDSAVQEGLLLRQDGSYRFLHDRIQQAAYTLVEEGERAHFQLEIGRALLASPGQQDAHFFDIANHFLLGLAAISDPVEKARCAHLFLDAGKRAKSSTAYKGAVTFIAAGVALLEPTSWADSYDLAYALHFELAECRWLSGDFDAAEDSVEPLLAHAHTPAEKFRIYGIRVRAFMVRSEREKAVGAGLEALQLIGIHLTLNPGPERAKEAREQLQVLLGDRPIESLLELPDMTNEEMRAALDLVAIMFNTAYYLDWDLYTLLACFAVTSSLRWGNTASSFAGYAVYSLICGEEGRYRDAYRYAQVAQASLSRLENRAQACKVRLLVGETSLWVRPYRNVLDMLERGYREGLENGDLLWAVHSTTERTLLLLAAGEPLEDLQREVERGLDFARRVKFEEFADTHHILARVIQKLRGPTSREEETSFDEAVGSTWSNHSRCVSLMIQLQTLCVFEAYEAALDVSARIQSGWAVRGIPFSSTFHFYDALTLAALYDKASPSTKPAYLARMRAHERSYCTWAASCRSNFAAHHVLIRAEIARVERRNDDAAKDYEEAVALARGSRLPQVEALANECAARFHRARGLPWIARMYLLAAHAAYARWGADAKVGQLERCHPELRDHVRPANTIASRPEQLDILSVVKAAQTISGELEVDRLIGRLLEVVLEQSGADLGRLLLVRGGELQIASEARATRGGIETSTPVDTTGLVPESVVNYVSRTCEKVLLDDAREPDGRGRFGTDEYLARNGPRSVLCLPIVRGAKALGLLYLENSLVSHAFTPERVLALDVIASQAAITLEIAFWIRQEHEARDALATSEARFRRLSDSNILGIFFCDLGGAISAGNDYFLDMLGFTREDLAQGRLRWTDLTPPGYDEEDRAAIDQLETTGQCRPFEKEYYRKDGSRVPVFLGASLLEGSKTEMVVYVLDIAERRRAENERAVLFVQEQQARSAAEVALKARDEFLLIAAHELRTPLTPLKMQIEMLASLARATLPPHGVGRSRLLELLDKSNQQVERLAALMAELLDVSRVNAAGPVLTDETTDLGEIVGALVTRYRAELARAGCTVERTGERQLIGRWDARRVEQVVTNLLTNAMKYGAGRPITIGLRHEGEHALLSVRDRGIGIEEKDQARIFDRFERAVSLRHFGGFGLGLYISREIVRAHGGNLTVESRPGAGAVFTVRLPCP